MPILRGTEVEKVYLTVTGEVHALRAIDFAVAPARITAIVGPSGAGKSTLVRIMGCLDRPTSGRVELDGIDIGGLSVSRRRRLRRQQIGYVFQRPERNLVRYLTAREHVRVAAQLRGSGERDDGLLDLVGLANRAAAKPAQLSGGEQQRLAFAMAVIGRPRLVLADEPTAELDRESASGLVALMRQLRDEGVTIAVASHDQAVIDAADDNIGLSHGLIAHDR